ncbi:MAG: response regulator [Candidatus Omnitrophica bacterium]|nr:response regulator [Candidatus Omnitrophota bacterium]
MCAKMTVPEAAVNILVVDDEENVRDLYVAVLNKEGNRVVTASNGIEAVERIKKEKLDLIILDLKMPGMHGTEVLEQIEDMINGTLVIIATAYPSLESSLEAIKMGVYDYIVKPFSPKDLRAVVQRATEKIRLVKENKQLLEELGQKNKELREKISQLEKFTKAAVNREEKMVELKERIKELEEKLKAKG